MSLSRTISRKDKPKRKCPKCHSKLIDKPGYGLVCPGCGYARLPKE